MFGQVLALCSRAGLVRAGTVAVDGTKLAANAALEANRSVDGLREGARRIVELAAEIDAREDELFGERRGDELPAELADPRTRAERIRRLLDELDAERAAAEAAQQAKVEAYEQTVRERGKRPVGRPPERALPDKVERALPKRVNLTDPDTPATAAPYRPPERDARPRRHAAADGPASASRHPHRERPTTSDRPQHHDLRDSPCAGGIGACHRGARHRVAHRGRTSGARPGH